MKYRRLGKTNLRVSVVGIGTWQFGGEWGQDFTLDEVSGIIKRGKALGINLIDTAECYGDHLSESLVGQAVKGDRHDWVIATKFGHRFTGLFERAQIWEPEGVQLQLEDSLRALQTDYIDLYQFHSGTDEVFKNDNLWTMLDKQVQAGKIRHIGISIGSNGNLGQTDAAEYIGAEAIQVVYNRLDKKPEDEVFNSCLRQDLGVLARVPLASGFLSGKYKPGARFAENDVRSKRTEGLDETLALVEKIKREEVPKAVSMAQWALAWCLQHEAVTTCIPGIKSIVQLESCAGAADLPMVSDSHLQAWQ